MTVPSCLGLPHDPERTHLGVRLGEDLVEPGHPLEPLGVLGDRVDGGTPRLPAELLQGSDVGDDVAGVAEAVLAAHHTRLLRAVLAPYDVRELHRRVRRAATAAARTAR